VGTCPDGPGWAGCSGPCTRLTRWVGGACCFLGWLRRRRVVVDGRRAVFGGLDAVGWRSADHRGRGPAASPPHAPLDDEPGTTGPGWKVGGAAVQPVTQVVGLAPGQGSLAAGEDTAAVTHGQGGTLGGLDDPGGPADLQGLVGAPPGGRCRCRPPPAPSTHRMGRSNVCSSSARNLSTPPPKASTQPNLGTSPCSAICVPRTTDPTKPTAVRGSQRSGRRGGLTVDTA
jgi:hypothetical protein